MFMEDESLLLDPHMDYSTITGLSSEVRERLFTVRPTTMVSNMHVSIYGMLTALKGAAKRMEGMTPSSVVALLRHAKRTYRGSSGMSESVAVQAGA